MEVTRNYAEQEFNALVVAAGFEPARTILTNSRSSPTCGTASWPDNRGLNNQLSVPSIADLLWHKGKLVIEHFMH